jgi:hypothetical protein
MSLHAISSLFVALVCLFLGKIDNICQVHSLSSMYLLCPTFLIHFKRYNNVLILKGKAEL